MKHLLLLAFVVPSFAADELPSADAVLNRYVEVTGGIEAYKKVKSEIATGKLEFPGLGLKGDLTRYSSGPDQYYVDVEIAAIGKIESGVSHGIVWENSVVQGPRIKSGEERTQAIVEAALVGSHDWRELGFKAEMAGVEPLNGEDCYKVILKRPEGKPMTVYFEKKSGLAVKTVAIASTQMGEIPLEAVMSDYKDFNGLKYPGKTIETAVGQTIQYTIDAIQFNVDIPASKFALPPEIQALADKEKDKATK